MSYGLIGQAQAPELEPPWTGGEGIPPEEGQRPQPGTKATVFPRELLYKPLRTITMPSPPPPADEGIMGWWAAKSLPVKVAIGAGGLVLLGGVLYLLLGDEGGGYAANPRRRGRRPARRRRYRRNKPRPLSARDKAPKGKIITIEGDRRFGRGIPSKRYWQMGAQRKDDYAWPAGWKYPLIFRHKDGSVNLKVTKKHIASAKTYFKRSKHLYPRQVRATIARNINKASKRFKVGPAVATP